MCCLQLQGPLCQPRMPAWKGGTARLVGVRSSQLASAVQASCSHPHLKAQQPLCDLLQPADRRGEVL